MSEPIPSSRRSARFSGFRATVWRSSPSTRGTTCDWRVRATAGTPRGSSRVGGQPSLSLRASSCFAGSGWMIARRRMSV